MCVVVPSGLLCPNKPTTIPGAPSGKDSEKPPSSLSPSWLSPLSSVQLTAAGTFGLLISLCSVFPPLSLSLSLTLSILPSH